MKGTPRDAREAVLAVAELPEPLLRSGELEAANQVEDCQAAQEAGNNRPAGTEVLTHHTCRQGQCVGRSGGISLGDKTSGARAAVWPAKLPHAALASHMGTGPVPVAPLPVQLPADGLGKQRRVAQLLARSCGVNLRFPTWVAPAMTKPWTESARRDRWLCGDIGSAHACLRCVYAELAYSPAGRAILSFPAPWEPSGADGLDSTSLLCAQPAPLAPGPRLGAWAPLISPARFLEPSQRIWGWLTSASGPRGGDVCNTEQPGMRSWLSKHLTVLWGPKLTACVCQSLGLEEGASGLGFVDCSAVGTPFSISTCG